MVKNYALGFCQSTIPIQNYLVILHCLKLCIILIYSFVISIVIFYTCKCIFSGWVHCAPMRAHSPGRRGGIQVLVGLDKSSEIVGSLL
jgi:hypothetical protein